MLALAAIVVVAVVGSTVGGIAVAGVDLASFDTTDWLILAIPLAVMLVVGAAAVAFVWWRRRRGSGLFVRSPLWELPRSRDRKVLLKALRRGEEIRPEQRDLALRVARDMTRRRGLIWIYVGVAVLFGVNVVLQDEAWLRWFWAALVALYLALAGYFWWLIGRMRRAEARLAAAGTAS